MSKKMARLSVLATGLSSIALAGSMGSLAYYLVAVKGVVIAGKIALSVIGAVIGLFASIISYWITRRNEREKKAIFLSYNSKDKGLAEKIEHDLRRDGFQVLSLHTAINVGERISEKIDESISKADYVILLISDATEGSSWIQKELAYAQKNDVPILPLLVQEDARIPASISDLRYVPLSDSYENAYDQLKQAITRDRSPLRRTA
jgi:ABC-type multidrug transport system fused ATPase/permease subunit